MKPNYQINPNQDISDALTRIYKQINTLKNECIVQQTNTIKIQQPKTIRPLLKLVK